MRFDAVGDDPSSVNSSDGGFTHRLKRRLWASNVNLLLLLLFRRFHRLRRIISDGSQRITDTMTRIVCRASTRGGWGWPMDLWANPETLPGTVQDGSSVVGSIGAGRIPEGSLWILKWSCKGVETVLGLRFLQDLEGLFGILSLWMGGRLLKMSLLVFVEGFLEDVRDSSPVNRREVAENVSLGRYRRIVEGFLGFLKDCLRIAEGFEGFFPCK